MQKTSYTWLTSGIRFNLRQAIRPRPSPKALEAGRTRCPLGTEQTSPLSISQLALQLHSTLFHRLAHWHWSTRPHDAHTHTFVHRHAGKLTSREMHIKFPLPTSTTISLSLRLGYPNPRSRRRPRVPSHKYTRVPLPLPPAVSTYNRCNAIRADVVPIASHSVPSFRSLARRLEILQLRGPNQRRSLEGATQGRLL